MSQAQPHHTTLLNSPDEPREQRLAPAPAWRFADIAELLRYHELLWALTRRDIAVRYKQTSLGVAWAVIQPLATMLVLGVFFGQLLGMADRVGASTASRVPYCVFLFAGLLPWTFFTNAVQAAAISVVNNSSLIRKVYFPRLAVPASAIGAPLVDFGVSLVVLALLAAVFAVTPSWQWSLVPFFAIASAMPTAAVSVLLASLVASYRDVRHVVPFAMQLLFFVTPVIYPVSIVPAALRPLLALNPIAGSIEACRAAVLGTPIDWAGWSVSMTSSAVILIVGLAAFGRVERRLADIV